MKPCGALTILAPTVPDTSHSYPPIRNLDDPVAFLVYDALGGPVRTHFSHATLGAVRYEGILCRRRGWKGLRAANPVRRRGNRRTCNNGHR